MRIKTLVMGVALALATSVGSAAAAEQFHVLDGVTAAPMNASQMAAVTGAHIVFPNVVGGDNRPFSVGREGETRPRKRTSRDRKYPADPPSSYARVQRQYHSAHCPHQSPIQHPFRRASRRALIT